MTFDEMFGGESQVVIATTGVSMLPLLRSGRDTVVLSPAQESLSPGDVALYERADGMLVLHRVIYSKGDVYAFLGDAHLYGALETDVRRAQIIGIMTGYFRGEKLRSLSSAGYRAYRKLCLSGNGPRHIWRAARRVGYLAHRIKRKIGKLRLGQR